MKPVGDIGTCADRGQFLFRTGPFQKQAPRPRHQLGLHEREQPFQRCQRPRRDNIGADRRQGFDALVVDDCPNSCLAHDGLQEHSLFLIRFDEMQLGIAQRREDKARKARATANIKNPSCSGWYQGRKLGRIPDVAHPYVRQCRGGDEIHPLLPFFDQRHIGGEPVHCFT